ncbi:hypothetical protein N7G274_004609 [Stereocaulon virgatum]|uniref:SprT-like domain-containing protein n=1 Tax=Stereocaulon virgatum TaxID=373712 RepID=A0ABR4ABJ8_9LECA
MYQYTANQIAAAFVHYIPNYMDWPIKQEALERWKELIPVLSLSPGEFDLKLIFNALNDFLFLGVLKGLCNIEWVNQPTEGRLKTLRGWCYRQYNMRGSPVQIRVVRPTYNDWMEVRDIVCTVMHEMCHALFHFACSCQVCRCKLNEMEGVGLTGHGPSWQLVRKTVEDTANKHLREILGWGEFSSRYLLSYSNEPDTGLEDKVRTKMLGGLYERIKRKEDERECEKIRSRRTKYLELEEKTPESDMKQQLEDDALACIKFVFDGREKNTQ